MRWLMIWWNSEKRIMAYFTDKELLSRFEFYTLQIEKALLKEEDVKSVIEDISCGIVLSKPEAIEIEYTNKRHLELTGYSQEQIRAECPQFLNNIVHPESLKSIRKFLPDFYATQNSHQTMFFIQYTQLAGDPHFSPIITFTKAPCKKVDLVIRMPLKLEKMGTMASKLDQIVEMDQFKLKHFKLFQKLTVREIEVLTLLANGHNNPQIAEDLCLSRQTIETHRKNLKRKLELHSFRDLMKYAFAFNLVDC